MAPAVLTSLTTPLRGDWFRTLSLQELFTFSFIPRNYGSFHGKVPVFGSLFTLLLLAIPFVQPARRIWLLVGLIHGGLFLWLYTYPLDRYLQAIVPSMAAVVAALIILIHRHSGWIVRTLAFALVGLQVVWGGDVYFSRRMP